MHNTLTQRTLSEETKRLSGYSTVFKGRHSQNNIAILKILATIKSMGTWELTQSILRERIQGIIKPSYNSVRSFYPTVFRRIKALVQDGFVEVQQKIRSEKGAQVEIYGLTFKGSLSALLLADNQHLNAFIRNTALSNPFSALAISLVENGLSWNFIRTTFIDSVREAIEKGMVNIDLADYRTLTTIFMAFLEKFCDYEKIPEEQRKEIVRSMLQYGFTALDEKAEVIKIGQMLGKSLEDIIVKAEFGTQEEQSRSKLNLLKAAILYELGLSLTRDEKLDGVSATLRELRTAADKELKRKYNIE